MIERFSEWFGPPEVSRKSGGAVVAEWHLHPGVTLRVLSLWEVESVTIILTPDDSDQTDVTIDGIRIQEVMRGA